MKVIKKILKGDFAKNILTLASGTTIAQLIVVLSTPILTRIFSPEDFGVYGVFMAITGILATVINLGFQHALIIPRYNHNAQILLRLSFIIACTLSISTFLFLLLYETLLLDILYIEEMHTMFLWSIPIMMLLVGMSQLQQNFLVRRKQYKVLSYSHAIRPSSMVTTQMLLGAFTPLGLIGLILGHLIGQLSTVLFIIKKKPYVIHLMLNKRWEKNQYIQEYKTHKNFPLYYVPTHLVGNISLQAPVLLLSILYAPYVVGLYVIGHRLLTMPTKFIGEAMATVFFKKVNDDKGKNNKIGFKLWSVLFPASTIIFGIFILGASPVFSIVLGGEWREAGVYAQWIAIWMLYQFVNTPLKKISPVYSKQNITFWLNLLFLPIRILSLLFGGLYHSPLLSIILYSLVSSIQTIITSSLYIKWESGKFFAVISLVISLLILITYSLLLSYINVSF